MCEMLICRSELSKLASALIAERRLCYRTTQPGVIIPGSARRECLALRWPGFLNGSAACHWFVGGVDCYL